MGYVHGTGDGVKRPSILAGSMSGKEELDWERGKRPSAGLVYVYVYVDE